MLKKEALLLTLFSAVKPAAFPSQQKFYLNILLAVICFSFLASCKQSNGIPTTRQLQSIINAMDYAYYGPYTSGKLPITDNITIVGTVTIASYQLKVPSDCVMRDDCQHAVSFVDAYGAEGIKISPYPPLSVVYPPGVLTLSDVTLRLRTILEDTHLSQYNFTPVVQILPPTDQPCGESQFRCSADQLCYNYFSSYCQYCLGMSQKHCACRGPDGILDNGTECIVWLSGDSGISGICHNGECAE
jgi:hypothetical protein